MSFDTPFQMAQSQFKEWNMEPDNSMQNESDELDNLMHKFVIEYRYTISKIVHPRILDNMCKMLAESYFEEEDSAINIAEDYNLDRLHFAAFLDLRKVFIDLYLEDLERQKGEWHDQL